MRTLNELYTILYDSIKDEEEIHGLCQKIVRIYFVDNFITKREYNVLLEHFQSQKPTPFLHPEFYAHYCYRGGVWWWSDSNRKQSTQQRKLFIKKMIEITKE